MGIQKIETPNLSSSTGNYSNRSIMWEYLRTIFSGQTFVVCKFWLYTYKP